MSLSKKPLVVIVGPTTSGKSELAIHMAKKINGEIICADSRQVYRGLDIGTAKMSKKEMRGVPHHCIDIADPKKTSSVEKYRQAANRAIEAIFKKQKTPILVGGSGFYIDAVLYDTRFPVVAPDWKLRKKLEKESPEKLFAMLQKLDPRRAKTIDPKNPRRLIRAIEIAKKLGRVPMFKKTKRFDAKIILLNSPSAILKKQIARRTDNMLKRGLLAEVKKIAEKLPRKRILELGFEYKYPLLYLEGKISKPAMVERINIETWHYAKRQLTYFKKMENVRWVISSKEAEKRAEAFLYD